MITACRSGLARERGYCSRHVRGQARSYRYNMCLIARITLRICRESSRFQRRLQVPDQVEEPHGQDEYNHEEYQRTVVKALAAPVLDPFEYPVGNHVKKYGSDRIIKHFHYQHPMLAGLL